MGQQQIDTQETKRQIEKMMYVITQHAEDFLAEETQTAVQNCEFSMGGSQQIELKPLTSFVSLGGHIDTIIAFSFDEYLIAHLTKMFTADIEFEEDEFELYVQETAGETVNTIVGQSTAELAPPRRTVSLTPPETIYGKKKIRGDESSRFFSATLTTEFGTMDIDLLVPTELFDNKLNFIGRGAPS
ncbi:chemotaxis protein CheX [Terasakiella sp. SH-1]|uniref:chemotaxis protein CheX n=1 Tax=Terasakiella sp. SH-1 TaxID=2560057 RepID=UPI0010746F17|nr:chemotaxis protein CheX [Terasakiella sp. SH-1]